MDPKKGENFSRVARSRTLSASATLSGEVTATPSEWGRVEEALSRTTSCNVVYVTCYRLHQ